MICLHLTVLFTLIQLAWGQNLENFHPNLSSTESTITVKWDIIDPENDTQYSLKHHRTNGIFITDLYFHAPFQKSHIEHTIRNLYPGVNYSVYIFRNFNTSNGRIFLENINTIPLPPVNLDVLGMGTTWLDLSWEEGYNSTQTSHEVVYTDTHNSGTRTVNATGGTTFNLTALEPGHRYEISVKAVTGDKKSNLSESIEATTVPGTPSNLVVRAVNTSHLAATWQAGTNSIQDGYQVISMEQGKNDEVNGTCSGNPPCVFAPGSLPGQLFTINVFALRDNLTSNPASIQHNTRPHPVSRLQGTVGVRSIQVTWNAPSHSYIVYYKVEVVNTQTTSQQTFNVTTNPVNGLFTFSEDSLQGGVPYNVHVFSAVQTEDSIDHSVLLVTIPEAPTGLKGTALNTSTITISWTLPRNSHIEHILVMVTKPSGDVVNITLDKEQTRTTIVNLIPGALYDVSVYVSTKVVDSAAVTGQFRTKPNPPAITSVVVTATGATVTLTKTGDRDPDYFMASITNVPGDRNMSLLNPTAVFSNLQEGTRYEVNAYSVSGDQTSQIIKQIFYTKPRPPTAVNVTAFNSTAIDVTWSGPDQGSFDNFTVTVVQSDAASQPATFTTALTYHAFPDVEAGETYNITIVTNLGMEESLPVLKQVTTTPFPITNLWVSSRGSTKVTINWDAPTGTSYNYFIYNFPLGNISMAQIPANQFEVVLDKLAPGTDYVITVYAVSKGIKDDLLSEGAVLNFVTYPTSVATLQKIESNMTGIHINWTSPVSSQSFDFFYLTISPPDAPEANITRGVGDHTYWYTGLRPGQMYNITINTVKQRHSDNNYIWGIQTYILAATDPTPVNDLEVISAGAEDLNVTWKTDRSSQQDFFTVEYASGSQSRSKEVQFIDDQYDYFVQLDQLLSGYTYNVTVKATRSIPQSDTTYSAIMWQTNTTAPKPVVSLSSTVADTTITLEWSTAVGSQQDSYRVDYRSVLRNPESNYIQLHATSKSQDLTDLFRGEMYQINVYALSGDMISDLTSTSAVIAPLAPANLSVITQLTNESSVTLIWTYQRDVTFVQQWSLSVLNDTNTLPAVMVTPDVTDQIQFTANNLRPGGHYQFDVMSLVEGKNSPLVGVNTTVKPVLNIRWSEMVRQTTNSSIVFTYSLPSIDDLFNRVQFSINDTSTPPISRSRNDNSDVTFSNLMAGTLYHVSAVSQIDDQTSTPQTLEIRTVPNAVPVTLTSAPNEVIVQLGILIGNMDSFIVQCEFLGTFHWNKSYTSDIHTVRVTGLNPFTNYTIHVTTVAGEKSQVESITIPTKQAAPTQVLNVRAEEKTLRSVHVTWDRPQVLNGILQNYIVSYSGHDPTINGPEHNGSKTVQANTKMADLPDLRAGYQYQISVRAVTVAAGMPGVTEITLKTEAPTLKKEFTEKTAMPRRSSTEGNSVGETFVKVTFPNAFSDANGRIIQYTVIVSTHNSKTDQSTSIRLPSWNDARKKTSITTYQTIGNCSNFFVEGSTCGMPAKRKRAADTVQYKVFTVGAEKNCAEKDYCNGPLKPETEYYFKLRAFTLGGYADTEYSQKIKTAATPSNAGGIIGGVIAAIIIIAIIAAVLIFLRRRRPKRAHKYIGDRTQIEQSSMHKFSRPVKIAEFKDHVRRMSADSDFRYAEEYEDLKEVGRDQPCLAAELPANRPKNRFTNILPYDHSRVKLLPTDDEEGSDYINANYVPGFISKREYIATQGPLPSTRDDFWRMLWEQNSRNIVMLTKCMEKGREKSDHYWPNDSEPKFYGDLQVAILNETHLPDWTISEFRIQLGEQARQIRHFHYKAWPDFGVPKDPTSLIRFVRTVREKMFREGGPVITHCSAGVGRSGTFIVLDHCLQRIKEHDQVDIYQIVYKLRKERVLMVQTEQQYKFIHECLLCVLEGREDEATYANVGHLNVAFDGHMSRSSLTKQVYIEDDEGINVEGP